MTNQPNSAEKKTLSGFEKFVFAITRVFALCGAAVIVSVIAILAMKLLSPGESTKVTYIEVAKEMAKSTDESDSDTEDSPSTPAVAAVDIPADLKPYFGGENERILRNWIDDLSEDQQRDFLNNMSQVVREAEVEVGEATDAINAYKSLKLRKLSSEGFEQYAAMATKAGYIAAIFGLLLILSILSLVLVMLTIERNTRLQSA
jgi:hypothetical protein